MKVLTTRIPNDLLKSIQEIEKEERAERAEVVRRLLDRAVHDWKLAKALENGLGETMDNPTGGQVCRPHIP